MRPKVYCCPNSHPLHLCTDLLKKYHPFNSTDQVTCSDCLISFPNTAGYFKCRVGCDFFLCQNCHITSFEKPKKTKKDVLLRCAKNHTMHFSHESANRKHPVSGQSINWERLVCNRCREDFACKQGYFSCENSHECDYDFCRKCGLNPLLTKIKCEN
jgi:hypothetical protein